VRCYFMQRRTVIYAALGICAVAAVALPAVMANDAWAMKTQMAQAGFKTDSVTPKKPVTKAEFIVEGARKQLVNPAKYTGKYYAIKYPNGDVPADRGACVDVVIRAFRHAGYDLQKLVHEDAKKVQYLRIVVPDTNIDHRRCPNLIQFFRRHGTELPLVAKGKMMYRPGDVIFWKLPDGLDHVGVVSDRISKNGNPMIIHNIGPETCETDVLHRWKIVGHFRYPEVES